MKFIWLASAGDAAICFTVDLSHKPSHLEFSKAMQPSWADTRSAVLGISLPQLQLNRALPGATAPEAAAAQAALLWHSEHSSTHSSTAAICQLQIAVNQRG